MEYRHGVTDADTSTSNLAPSGKMGFTATVGGGSLEVTSGYGMTQSRGAEFTHTPSADAATGYTFMTEAGHPVPAGGPRPHDLVVIHGMPVKVGQAVRDGLIADPAKAMLTQTQSDSLSAPNGSPQGNPYQAPERAPEAPESAADVFTKEVLPSVSPATTDSLMADLMEGEFSEKTTDYLKLEGGLSDAGLEAVRDAYAAKVTAATGMDEAELAEVYQADRAGFAKAAQELLTTGKTTAFQALAEAYSDASYTPLSTDEAMTAWQDADFPQALIDAGLEPIFEGGDLAINIPGMGVVPWAEAVQRGLVKVSRHG
ncbi:hypothetical protein [Celeribacter halophilus]|uniref:hypothetical protein n=1 Tax=Celeribacter halophilus TaxID=576117 RepID=UPI003A912FA1